MNKKLWILFFLFPIFFISNANAARQVLCISEATGKMIIRRRCTKKQTLLNSGNFDLVFAAATSSIDMSGTWTYTPIDKNNLPGTARQITFTQNGPTFEGSNDFHTIIGRIEGRWLRLTQTVSGEEGEGFVRFAEGSLQRFDSGFILGTLAVVGDTFGEGGAFILRKAAPSEE